MKIIITGAAGFIGSNLAKRALAEGHHVLGIDDFSYGNPGNLEPLKVSSAFDFYRRDLKDGEAFDGLTADCVIHLASQKIPRYSSAFKTLDDNSRMLQGVLAFCRSKKAHLLFASTSDIYGKNPAVPYHEESDILLGPTTVRRWAYATSKIYGEQLIQACHQEWDLKFTIMRFFGSFGPHQNVTWWGGPQSVFIQNLLEGKQMEIHGDGLQTRTFTYVEDTVDGIYRCMTDPKAENEIFNIAGNPSEEIAIVDLAKLIHRLMNGSEKTAPINYIPYSSFGKYEDVRRRVPSIEKISNQLGFRPNHHLEEGLLKTIFWQRSIYKK
jgi:UDP-glucose 4-epimerase